MSIQILPVAVIDADGEQHRKHFDEAALNELAQSIKEVGLLEPIVVIPNGDRYRIVAGERRWRATQIAGIQEIAASVRDLTPLQVATIQATENIARCDVRPCEEGRAYQRIWDEFRAENPDVSEPKSIASWIANATGSSWNRVDSKIALLQLPDEVQGMVDRGEIGEGSGYALTRLVKACPPEQMQERQYQAVLIARTARAQGLSYSEVSAKVSVFLGEKAQMQMFDEETKESTAAREARTKFDHVGAHLARAVEIANDVTAQEMAAARSDKVEGLGAKIEAAITGLRRFQSEMAVNRGKAGSVEAA